MPFLLWESNANFTPVSSGSFWKRFLLTALSISQLYSRKPECPHFFKMSSPEKGFVPPIFEVVPPGTGVVLKPSSSWGKCKGLLQNSDGPFFLSLVLLEPSGPCSGLCQNILFFFFLSKKVNPIYFLAWNSRKKYIRQTRTKPKSSIDLCYSWVHAFFFTGTQIALW